MLKGNRGHHSLRGGGTHGLSILALCVAGLLLLTLFWQVQNSKKTQLEIKQKYEAEISNYQETKDKLLWQLTEKQDESQRCTELMKSKTQEMNELETKLRKQEQDKSDAESEHSKLMESIQTYQTTIQSNEEKIQGMEAALKQETINKNQVQSLLNGAKEELSSLKSQSDILKQQNEALNTQLNQYQQEIDRLKQQNNNKNNANAVFKMVGKGQSDAQENTQDKEIQKTYAEQLSDQIIGADDYLSKADIADVLPGQKSTDANAQIQDSAQILREPKPKEKTVEIAVQKQQIQNQNIDDQNNYQQNNPDQIVNNQQDLEQNKNPDQAAFERVQKIQNFADNQKQQQLQQNDNIQQQDETFQGNNPDTIAQNPEIQQNANFSDQKAKKVVYEDDDEDSNLKTLNQEGDKMGVGIKKYEFKKGVEDDDEGKGVRNFEQGGRNSYENDDNVTGDFQDDDPAVQAIQGDQDESNIGFIRRDSGRTGGQLRGTSSVKDSQETYQEKKDTNTENLQSMQAANTKDVDRKSTRLNSSHEIPSRMPSSA
eukprot:TRINITY_DN4554_c0_g1_i13.p1 TRINITY_DN4554_c0_g1~~TRINITY_DN4554_c0_g1_i13.p1  ORF type:complete len:557 (+),score=110.63 TRINITY_DN4554_c0_g1_i13:50-1672(+)